MANSMDPDQTAPIGAVEQSVLVPLCLSQYLIRRKYKAIINSR